MKKAIAIPIYFRLNQPEELPRSEELHLARRAIESLGKIEDQDFTLILPVCFDMTGGDKESSFREMDRLIRKEFQKLWKGKTFLFSSYHLNTLRKYGGGEGLGKYFSLTALKGFSNIRNTALLLTQGLSIDVVAFIDSDEVVEDPHYLEVACEYLNETWNGKVIHGKCGFYLNPDNTILLPAQHLWWRFLWNKTKWMNRVWEKILSTQDRLTPSPMLLGGNLILHRHLFTHIPFDPYIPRGEDTDYLVNASQLGFCILFDKQLRIKHLHPERTEFYFQEELRWDIERFLYERKKTKMGLNINLDPYPGHFLRWTLYPKALLTSLCLGLEFMVRGRLTEARKCFNNSRLVFKRRNGGWMKYVKFRRDWEKVMEGVRTEGLGGILESCWV